jgi:hypothetical protein
VAVAAVLDEGRLQRRLNARHLGEIDVASKLFAVLALEIELFNAGSVDHHHTRLFGVCGIDQHSLGHSSLRGARGPLGPGAAGLWDERAWHPRRTPATASRRAFRPRVARAAQLIGCVPRRVPRGADRMVRRHRGLRWMPTQAVVVAHTTRPNGAAATRGADIATWGGKRKAALTCGRLTSQHLVNPLSTAQPPIWVQRSRRLANLASLFRGVGMFGRLKGQGRKRGRAIAAAARSPWASPPSPWPRRHRERQAPESAHGR